MTLQQHMVAKGVRNGCVASGLGIADRARSADLNLSLPDPNDHHQIREAVFSPAAKPAHLPIIEARADRNRCAKAKKSGLQAHVSVLTFMAPRERRVKAPRPR